MMDPGDICDIWMSPTCFNDQEHLHVEKRYSILLALKSIADVGCHPRGKSNWAQGIARSGHWQLYSGQWKDAALGVLVKERCW